ncbi:hypothetical protein [Aestuariispira insulae]|uniref:hypothetical protein n=1 Tax=Aestuariispira insulae TaxID=1461337 RepID=UPI0015F27664|nr:hypothetical protein [Aestuariispira insulae]
MSDDKQKTPKTSTQPFSATARQLLSGAGYSMIAAGAGAAFLTAIDSWVLAYN